MTRAYLRLDPDFAERKRAYPDGPFRTLVETLCLAEQEPRRGLFRSLDVLRALLGRRLTRHIPYLVEHHDLELRPDGRVYVVGWDEWQEGDWQVAERMRRVRARREANVTGPTVTNHTVPTVTPPSQRRAVGGLAVGGGGKRPTRPSATEPASAQNGVDEVWVKVMALAEELTGVAFPLGSPYGGFGAQALSQAKSVPWDTFEAGWRRVAGVYGRPTVRQLVFDAEDVLRPTGKATGAAVEPEAPDPAYVEAQLKAQRESRKRKPDA